MNLLFFASLLLLPSKGHSTSTLVPISDEFLLNDVTAGRQTFPHGVSVRMRSFLVSWTSELDREKQQIVLQSFQCGETTPVADVPLQASHTTGDNTGGELAFASSGNLLAWWENSLDPLTEDLRDYSIVAQFVDDAGKPISDPYRPTGSGLGNEFYPDVASARDGSTVLVWIDYNLEPGSIGEASRIRWQRFTNSSSYEPIVDVAPYSAEHLPINPGVAVLENGNIVAVSQELERDGNGDGIALFGFEANGSRLFGPIVANQTSTGHQQFPQVLAGPDGMFLVAWQGEDGSGLGVFAQLFNAQGMHLGSEILVNETTVGTQDIPSLTRTADGYLIGWRSQNVGTDFDVFARKFDWEGSARTGEIQLNSFNEGDQQSQFGMADAAGNILFLWVSPQDGDRTGIVGRFFASTDAVCGDVILGTGCRAISAADALAVLRGAVAAMPCDKCQCDVNGSGDVTSSDALLTLRLAVGLSDTRRCPSCSAPTRSARTS